MLQGEISAEHNFGHKSAIAELDGCCSTHTTRLTFTVLGLFTTSAIYTGTAEFYDVCFCAVALFLDR